jgi:hypothetical protein
VRGTASASLGLYRATLWEAVLAMSSWRINAVATEKSVTGSHEHISEVHVSNSGSASEGIWLSRATVVQDIRSEGDDYYTLAGASRAVVKVVDCPLCSFKDYLRSERDATTADNLLALPRKN